MQIIRITSFALIGSVALVSASGMHSLRPSNMRTREARLAEMERRQLDPSSLPLGGAAGALKLPQPGSGTPAAGKIASPANPAGSATKQANVNFDNGTGNAKAVGNGDNAGVTGSPATHQAAVNEDHRSADNFQGACSVGSPKCCNTMISDSATKTTISNLAGLQSIEGMLGLSCVEIPVMGGAVSNQCKSTPVCCSNVSQDGLINIGCNAAPIN